MNITDIKVVMTGNHELLIENYKGIIDYQENRIMISGKSEKLLVLGKHMCIDYYSRYDLNIRGRIESLQWIE